ncbi:Hypothetical_protein [Hexamita inflata]|uniref:Hypothetical_protein n=1 Tax=Hexamita inflata TaxID=28002 RepID=A0AA86UW56_9EUKA|nr:Hypothetical protein HINF_LOCUS61860 [Hexamita inflata]
MVVDMCDLYQIQNILAYYSIIIYKSFQSCLIISGCSEPDPVLPNVLPSCLLTPLLGGRSISTQYILAENANTENASSKLKPAFYWVYMKQQSDGQPKCYYNLFPLKRSSELKYVTTDLKNHSNASSFANIFFYSSWH